MTTPDALTAAVLADPADDLPRLVFADWLEENGQGARAEFIRSPGLLRFRNERYGWIQTGGASLSQGVAMAALQVLPDAWPAGVEVEIRHGFWQSVRCTLAVWCGGECHLCGAGGARPEDCARCGGRGEVAGIGPRVVREQPVDKVVLADPPAVSYQRNPLGEWTAVGDLTIHGYTITGAYCDVWFASQDLARQAWDEWQSAILIAWAKSQP